MSYPTEVAISIWLGDNAPPVIWQFPFDLTGSDARLSVKFGARLFHRTVSTGGLALDAATDRISWAYAASDFREMSGTGWYELTRIVTEGETRTYACGAVTLKGRINA